MKSNIIEIDFQEKTWIPTRPEYFQAPELPERIDIIKQLEEEDN